ncbi:hypothetical protein B7P43_G10374 [Cryptotermes secundus]|uniref:Ionotropic glutamate receptor C-terminal domain-containing protein n=2 Tax=Cryptotermes secundus TaxID=105785 RepID=A0A2J7PUE8_9NEOP|nr:hypothetical protein B7P43_G10374 [Cryptotermes secundus]
MVYAFLQKLNHITRWPLQISCVGSRVPEIMFDDFGKHHSYMIFTWADEGEDDIMGNLIYQLEEMKDSPSWNPRARFIVAIIAQPSQNASLMALEIAEELWNNYRVADVLLMVPKADNTCTKNAESACKKDIPLSFGLYTWIPYESHKKCAKINVFLIGELTLESKRRSLKGASLFPVKIPKHFHGCPLNVSTIHTPPALVVNNVAGHIHSGLEVQYLDQFAQAMNATLVYQEVAPGDAVTVRLETLSDLHKGSTDLAFGGFPLHPTAAVFADPTVSYLEDNLVWYVPCGMPNARMERVAAIFTPSLWLAMCTVFLLIVVVMWGLANCTRFTQINKSHACIGVSDSISVIWAVYLGVSAPKIPRNDAVRTMFIFVVWYSFATSCVFQTYFTSILVNPGMSQQIVTLEELYQSNLVYHYNNRTDSFVKFTDPEYYSEIRLEKKECRYRGTCIIDYLSNTNVATISSSFHAEYYTLAAIPAGSSTPRMCTLKDKFYNIRYTMYIEKGSFLVDSFNRIIRRVIEAGLIEKLKQDTKTSWRYGKFSEPHLTIDTVVETNRDESDYFVFSMSHLKLAFYFLILGYLLSIIMIVGELLFARYTSPQEE